ncbi:PREDICTED: probable cytochrome P450 4aa1 [Polistes dominula]|uniref:Probable cytochrome P450 4aa1 n=1 Tax=Polistes dominula TaxID=743375 RepID=A0ABM1IEV4_POLDO|nr:PREDICTED: probable cytochrome P450 4aa1 [Polistes dominula]
MIRFWISVIPFIMIIRPESIKKVLNNSEQTKKPSVYFLFLNYLGKGLLTSQGETYKLHQKILQNFFTVPKMKMYNKTFLEHAEYLIEESKKKDKQQRNDKISLIEYLIDAKQNYPNFNNNDILDEVSTFMLAGLESVSTATTLGLFLLANHPEWQENCFEELKQIFEDCSTLTSVDSFKKMKYLEMCIKETLRLYPTVVTICRRLCKDTEIDGQTLPVGTHVLISPYITHRIPDYYPDPESFKPERFDVNNSKKLDPHAYIPFSIGNRKCIGNKFTMLEMKAIFSTIIRNFILEPVENKHKINVKFRLTLRAKGGVWIKFRPREPMTDFYTNM